MELIYCGKSIRAKVTKLKLKFVVLPIQRRGERSVQVRETNIVRILVDRLLPFCIQGVL
ncbi:MAG: hypothetical protein ACI8T1_003050 [Verrucomicrobiales bacterium]|jgi:hypothetical protein